MKLSDINPHIRYAATHYHYINKPFDSICYDCRLFFIKDGSGHIIADGLKYPFSGHTTLFFPPGTRYHFYPDKNCHNFTAVVINFDLINDYCYLSKSLGTASELDFMPERLIIYELPAEFSSPLSRKVPSIADMLDRCSEEFFALSPLYRETSSALLKFCLIEMARNSQMDERDKIVPVLDFIHVNYPDASLTNESIAERFNYHPYYLSQMIKQHTGQSLRQYLISYRIKMAKKKLITTDDAISTVAWKSGFQSPAYFIKMFKEQTGTTPGAYRKEKMQFLF